MLKRNAQVYQFAIIYGDAGINWTFLSKRFNFNWLCSGHLPRCLALSLVKSTPPFPMTPPPFHMVSVRLWTENNSNPTHTQTHSQRVGTLPKLGQSFSLSRKHASHNTRMTPIGSVFETMATETDCPFRGSWSLDPPRPGLHSLVAQHFLCLYYM